MGKVLYTLEIPEPKLRKKHAPASKLHKDKNKYSRKQKHRGASENNSEAPFLWAA